MEPIRTLIVDDEAVARRGVRALLADNNEFDIIGEARNGQEALDAIRAQRPELVLLDIQMPVMDGFECLAAVESEIFPVVIFLTAHDAFALRAFDARALDYVLKPVREERLHAALERAREQVKQRRLGNITNELQRVLAQVRAPAQTAERLAVRVGEATSFVEIASIDWIEAANYYARIHVGAASHLVRESLDALEGRLDPKAFVRVHRSALVNIQRIKHVVPLSRGQHEIVMNSGARIMVSRRRRAELEAALGVRL